MCFACREFIAKWCWVSRSLVSGFPNRLLCPIDIGYPRYLRFNVLIQESLTIYWCQCQGSTFSSIILRPWVEVRPRIEPRFPILKGKRGGPTTLQVLVKHRNVFALLVSSCCQCRINHMAEAAYVAAYAAGPALLGAPRLLSSIFPNFLFPVSARGPNSAPLQGPKEPKSPKI